MSDIGISNIYLFLTKAGDWKTEADRNSNGIISKIEAFTYLDNNFFQAEGMTEQEKDDIFYKFWKSIDTNVTGKVKSGSKVNNKGTLTDDEIQNVERNIKIAERIDNFVDHNIKGKEPSVISNKAGWLNSVKDGIMEKAFDYIAKNKNAGDISDDKIREFYELTYRKATADYYASDLKANIAKELNLLDENNQPLYKVESDMDLKKIIDSYVQSLDGDTTTSLETIIAKVKELIEAYKDTAVNNSQTSINTLQPYGYANDTLNDLQKTTIAKTMFDAITKYFETNNSDYKEFKEQTDTAIKSFLDKYLSNQKASDFVTLNNFDINEFIKTDDYQTLLKVITDARSAKDAATRAETSKLYGELANDVDTISGDDAFKSKICNGNYAIHTEFGMDANGNIVFEQKDTSDVYDKLKTNVIDELKQRHPAEFEKIGQATIEKLIQAAWITTYNDFVSSAYNWVSLFIDKVMENLKNILSKVTENPEYIDVYTSHTAYANHELTSNLDLYGTNKTDGNDSIWIYETDNGKQNISSDGVPTNWIDKTDAAEYQKTMNALLTNIKNTEPYKSLDSTLIESVFRDAQAAALSACSGNINDCPYGTTNDVDGDIATNKSSPVATANQDWSGKSREDDDWEISPKALVEMTLYFFDKLLYQKLLG